jgi:hypothetical protein
MEGIMAEAGKSEIRSLRKDRLAKALRENLKRRKEQQRKRETSDGKATPAEDDEKCRR